MKKFTYYKSLLKTALIFLKDKVFLGKPASILMYHSVSDNPEFFTVTSDDFEKQMVHLFNNKYNVISLNELIEKLNLKLAIPKKTVVITFDDGYEDNYVNAFPVLKKYNFPATIFIVTGRIGNKEYVNKRGVKMPVVDWEQIIEMTDSGLIDFQPHTVTHPRLSTLSIDEARREILESKRELESKLKTKCGFFAYPYGDFNYEVATLAKGEFDGLITVSPGFIGRKDQPKALNRNSIESLTTLFSFRLKI